MQSTAELVRAFNDRGFVAVAHPLCPEPELAQLRAEYDALFAAEGDDSASRRERGLLFDLGGPSTLRGESADIERWTLPQVLSPGLGASAPQLLKNAGEIARALLVSEPGWDEPTPLAAAHCILKPPRTGATTPWHQDDAYGPPTALEHRRVSCWVPLQDATVTTGCMHFVPGSHHWPELPHHHINHDPRIHGLEVQLEAPLVAGPTGTVRAVPCPVPAGGATFHLSRTLHFSGPNLSDTPRRAVILGAGCPSRPGGRVTRKPWQLDEISAYAIGTRGYRRNEPGSATVGTPRRLSRL